MALRRASHLGFSSRVSVAVRAGSVVEALERRGLLSVTTLTPVTDADVQRSVADAAVADANFGADSRLRVQLGPDGTSAESFLSFDLASIASVGHAVLRLHGGQAGTPATAVTVGVFKAGTAPFVEGVGVHTGPPTAGDISRGDITFNHRPATTGGSVNAKLVYAAGDYYFDVTGTVQAAKAAGATTVTLALRHVGGGDAPVTFASRETGGSDVPQLLIEQNTQGPAAAFFAPDITKPGAATQQVVVTYSDNDSIDTDTIDVGDIDVRAPSGAPLAVTAVTLDVPDANSVIATYTVAAPGGTWDASDAPIYTTILKDGAVADVAGNPATGGPDVFTVVISPTSTPTPTPTPAPTPTDTQAPVAEIQPPANVTTPGGTGTTVGVTFTDDAGVETSAVNTASLVLTKRGSGGGGGPDLPLVQDVNVQPSADGRSVVVLFEVAAPGGSWDAGDNGTYDVQLAGGVVRDAAGNVSAPQEASFAVNITGEPTPGDTAGPVASVVPLDAQTEDEGGTRDVLVTFTDDTAVDVAGIDVGDIVVTGPGGVGPLEVSAVSVNPQADGPSVTATYTVAAPGGAWDEGDNGTYTVSVAAGAVTDTNGNAGGAATGEFAVSVPTPPPPVDPTFGGGTSTVNTGFVAEAAAAQVDGRIVVVGRQGDVSAGTSQLVVKRLNPDGSTDTTFGGGGTVLGAQGANEAAFAVAIDNAGNIIVAGQRGDDMMVTRFKPTGALDTRFGTGGVSVADSGGGAVDVAYSLAIAPDGSLVLAGGTTTASEAGFAFARFTSDGNVDAFFGTNGMALFAAGNGGNVVGAVAIDPGGRIVGAGPADGGRVALVRLNVNGLQDAGFGNAGVLVLNQLATRVDLGRPDRSIGVASLPDGSLLVSNHSAGNGDDFAVAKVKVDGAVDNTFGDAGVAAIDFGGEDDADQLLVQGSGEILALGTTTADGNRIAVAALGADGSLIRSFGDDGKLTVEAQPTATDRELHIGDLVLRAFGGITSTGQLVVGASDQGPAAVTSSPLRRLNVPGSGSLGTFGVVPGVKGSKKLMFQDADGTFVTISLKGKGTGQAFYNGTTPDLVLANAAGSSLMITTSGGSDGRTSIRNVQADGALKSVTAKSTDLAGTFSVVGGGINKVSIGNVTGTFAVAGPIVSFASSGDVKGKVLSGASFGVGGRAGGSGSAADTFSEGRIGKIAVAGQTVGATFAAGVDPVDQKLLNGDDRLVGGSGSAIGSVAIKGGADASTRFVAGAFAKKVKLPQPVDPFADPRFMLLE